MTCADVERLIDAYADGELTLETSLAIEAHLDHCAACAARLAGIRALSDELKAAPYFRAPARLAARIAPPRRRVAPWRPWLIPAAGIAAVLLVAAGLWQQQRSAAANANVEAVIGAHVRSLIAGHLMDVASTDQHTVKPWFTGRLNFSPTVVDLAGDGFPLVGGRVDYVAEHSAAALVYKRREHTINVFIWPDVGGSATHVSRSDPRGYHVISWTRGGVSVWIVSDVGASDLTDFANRLDAAMNGG